MTNTTNISDVLERNGLTEDNVRSLAYVVEHGGIYPRVRRVLETVARLLDSDDAGAKRDARAILAEVLR